MASYAQLLWTITRHGRIRHRGQNFNAIRSKVLQGLEAYIPGPSTLTKEIHSESNRFWYGLRGQLAYIRDSYKHSRAHIAVPGLKLAYIRIPKSASTSASAMMLSKKYETLDVTSCTAEMINALIDVNLEAKMMRDLNYFTLVRNPFARIVSVYRDFFERTGEQFLYEDYLFGILKRDMTFSEFIMAIEQIPDRLKDQHLKPQHSFIEPYRKRKMNVTVMKVEESEVVESFLNKYGLTLPRVNQSDPYDFRAYYDRTSLEIVKSIYAQDILVFDYQGAIDSILETD